jgi:hypothetical protein
MNYLLFLIILVMAGGGYFEYKNLQQSITFDDQRVATLQSQLDTATADNKKALADKDGQLDEAQQTMKAMQVQLDSAQNQLAEEKPPTPTSQPAAPSPSPTLSSPALTSTKLGNIVTLDGKTYTNCQLLKVNADGIVVNHTDGITKILFDAMPPELQQTFGFDPHAGSELSPTQLMADESKRQVAASAGN